MAKKLDAYIGELPAEDKQEIDARSKELIAEVRTLGELRKKLGVSQAELAEALEITQPSVSKFERREKVFLTTLATVISAMGGELDVVARFPGKKPIRIHLPETGKPSKTADTVS